MKKRFIVCLIAGMFALSDSRALCQMVIHAMTGTIRSVKSDILSATANGSTVTFALKPKTKVSYSFDGELRSDSVPANEFHKVGAFAVIYYYGLRRSRTAIAVKDLGAGPFYRATGTVKSFDKHNRRLTITTTSGSTQTFTVSDKAVIDAGSRVIPGRKVEPHDGNHVRVTAISKDGMKTAVFIRLRR